ncbi:MAG: UDP-3-O-[3-hydroxymyristoyl] N-acetylglucosamine deacetylase, partial [Betaproteobacteria bacterium]|nr:UDP-3-O-[3-hydroxymyristoyl] N-acetylglucosamine deacetylase [Betaproteobacteria bacterium]
GVERSLLEQTTAWEEVRFAERSKAPLQYARDWAYA